MLRRSLLIIYVAVAFLLSVGTIAAQELKSLDILYGVELESFFDNREFSAAKGYEEESGTDFAGRFMPTLGLGFAEGHSIYVGANIYMPFGITDGGDLNSYDPSLVEQDNRVEPVAYYNFEGERWMAAAGIFPRSKMHLDTYSTAFFEDDYLFYNSLVSGVMGGYSVGESFVEFACDWQGQPTPTTREKFTLLSAARRYWSSVYVGYKLSVTHFAGAESEYIDNVVDNSLVAPCVGLRLDGRYSFEVRAAYLQSMQRDRSYENEWLSPSAGEFIVKLSRWGLSVDERLYIGDNLIPLYGGHTVATASGDVVMQYGKQLYSCSPFFGDEGGYYNRASLNYERRFCGDIVGIKVQFVTHAVKSGFGTEQLLDIDVKLGGRAYRAKI